VTRRRWTLVAHHKAVFRFISTILRCPMVGPPKSEPTFDGFRCCVVGRVTIYNSGSRADQRLRPDQQEPQGAVDVLGRVSSLFDPVFTVFYSPTHCPTVHEDWGHDEQASEHVLQVLNRICATQGSRRRNSRWNPMVYHKRQSRTTVEGLA